MATFHLSLGGLIFAVLISWSLAINEDSAKESPCLNIKNAVDPDETWFNSVEKWYYPLASRLDLYRSVHDLLATDYKNIPEYSLYYDSCLEWGIDSNGFTIHGYNGKSRLLRTTPVGPGTSDFKSEWSQGMIGRAYTTLTDNKTFAFTAACFKDNQMSWNVFATTKTLNEATKLQIFEHAKSLGYNPEYFTEIRYDSCTSKDAPVISTTVTKDQLGKTSFCTSCKKRCPNFISKKSFMHKYYKMLQHCKEIS